jgi:triacylglycerol esterase/lipase EstA (alpha/beta hydrolase family)
MLLITSLISGNIFHYTSAHFVGERNQQWQSKKDNVLIQFTYQPKKPIFDSFTELKFNIENVSTGEYRRDITARVVVTNGQRYFQFDNISIANGHFSVKYIFPDDGTHQVLL